MTVNVNRIAGEDFFMTKQQVVTKTMLETFNRVLMYLCQLLGLNKASAKLPVVIGEIFRISNIC